MTDTADPVSRLPPPLPPRRATAAPRRPPLFDAERRATELAILDALRAVVDPEIGMNVVELALIKQILLGENETEIKMILTTPFCPYAGSMIAQVTGAGRVGRRAPGQGHAARRALGPARRGPDVVTERTLDSGATTHRLTAAMSRRSPIDSVVATTRGDDGTTGLLYGGDRIAKDDPRTEAYGTVDEAIAALGMARANLGVKRESRHAPGRHRRPRRR